MFEISQLAITSGLLLAVYLFYQWLLPKPLPEIPYHEPSSKRLLGDIPDSMKEPDQLQKFFGDRCIQLKSNIIQLWMSPFKKPWVIINDWALAQDILYNRVREFDRSDFHLSLFVSIIPNGFVSKRTSDPAFHTNRRYVGDTMANGFLHDVAAPVMLRQMIKLGQLWKRKIELTPGRTFDANKDVQLLTADFMWAVAIGPDLSACDIQIQKLQTIRKIELPSDVNEVIVFPRAEDPDLYTAFIKLSESCAIVFQTPLGAFGHWLALKLVPKLSRAVGVKNAAIRKELETSWERMSTRATEDRPSRAIDLMVKREIQFSKKENREPNLYSPMMLDEAFSFVLVGVDSTKSVMSWGMKYLSYYQNIQSKLRKSLHEAFSAEAEQKIQLNGMDVARASIPYLDAFVEESLRFCDVAPFIPRVATSDAEVGGYKIPKGTQVFFPGHITKQNSNGKLRPQAPLDMFDPERWLDEEGNFDTTAAPMFAFGAGPRGCFGRRMAYINEKLYFAWVTWNFELEKTVWSEDFPGYDALGRHPKNLKIQLRDLGIHN